MCICDLTGYKGETCHKCERGAGRHCGSPHYHGAIVIPFIPLSQPFTKNPVMHTGSAGRPRGTTLLTQMAVDH